MSPELKFHSYVTTVTTFVVFSIWTFLSPYVAIHPLLALGVAGASTLGFYKFFSGLLLVLFRKSKRVKKFILGSHYLEGTWVGYFIGHENKVRYLVEVYEQDLAKLKVRGRVFSSQFTHKSTHVSSDVSIDIGDGKLNYTYTSDAISNTHINPGLACFSLDRVSSHDAPTKMSGYSADLFNPKKLPAMEEKISDYGNIEIDESLNAAKAIYEKHNTISQKIV